MKQAIERGEKVMTSPNGLSYPKLRSVRMEVDIEECCSAIKADLLVTKKEI